jgi:glycerophosphoryl diester phosphodiesterase
MRAKLIIAALAAKVLLVAAAMPGAVAQERSKESPAAEKRFRIDPKTPEGLKELLAYSAEGAPLVSAHRGGPMAGFPENCIATFEHTLAHGFAMLEIDPRYAKDGAIVVHHDPTLERTTTGKGRLVDFSLKELRQLKLKDTKGNVTEQRMPTLDEVLEWARGKTVLVLDQKDVPTAARVKKIEEHKAEAYAMLIVYSFQDAQECFQLNPNVMMEVMIPNREKAAEFDQLGVPWRNVIAFVGHVPPEDRGLYELESGYREFLARGADVIETDIPVLLAPMLYEKATTPVRLSKWLEVR